MTSFVLQGDIVLEQYKELKGSKLYGTYYAFGASPCLYVCDPEIIRVI